MCAGRAPGRILIVEDDRTGRAALAALLADEGYEISEAGSGAEALAVMERVSPRLALVDHGLPDTDGVSLIRAIRERDRGCACVMVSGSASLVVDGDGEARFQDHQLEAMEAGAAGFLAKPVDVASLLELVQRTIG